MQKKFGKRSPIALNKPFIGIKERLAVDRVLRSGALAQGALVQKFEDRFSETVEGYHSIAVNSGTSALHIGLLALGIGMGDEVIVPSFSFAATANAVALCGAKPVFADIDSRTFCLDPKSVQALIGPRTVAILAVHIFGHPAPMVALRGIAEKHNLALVEDAAQAHLASVQGKPVGTWGDFAAFSFYPTKNMTTGEGGMITCRDPDLMSKARMLRNQGMAVRYQNELVGLNNRLTEIGAAIGLVQLERLGRWTEERISNAQMLSDAIQGVQVPLVESWATHVYHQYSIRTEANTRGALAEHLKSFGIASDVYYPTPIHKLPSFQYPESLPVTEDVCRTILSIPVHPKLRERDIRRISSAVNSFSSGSVA